MARSADAVHAVIKAYDVRGLLGEQIDESLSSTWDRRSRG